MEKFTYNMFNEVEFPTVILSNANHKHYGSLDNIDKSSFNCTFNMNGANEISFDVYKYFNEKKCTLWNKLRSFKYVYIPEHHEYYKIDVSVDESNKTVKHITGTSAGEYELSNRRISIEINTTYDLLEDETLSVAEVPYSTFYNPVNPELSMLHRILKDKTPDWSIGEVDETLWDEGATFSISNQDIYSILTSTIATEIQCLFLFDSVNRVITVHDILNKCADCGKRGEFTDTCTECGSHNIIRGYGKDTHIFISAENFAEQITVDGDEGNVKNALQVTGADDDMNAAIINLNPAGTDYIYRFSSADLEDMSDELVAKLNEYNEAYRAANEGGKYDKLVEDYYDAIDNAAFLRTVMMPRNGVKHWKDWNSGTRYTMDSRVYIRNLAGVYYLEPIEITGAGRQGDKEPDGLDYMEDDIIVDGDIKWKVKVFSVLDVPSAEITFNTITAFLHDNIVYFEDKFPVSIISANRIVKNLILSQINPLFRVEISDTINSWTDGDTQRTWTAEITVINTTDQTDKYIGNISATLEIASDVHAHMEYMKQLVQQRLDRADANFTDLYKIEDIEDFKKALTEFSLDMLKNYAQSYEDCKNVLIENKVTDENKDFHGAHLYEEMYIPYNERLEAIDDEIAVREKQIMVYDYDPTEDDSEYVGDDAVREPGIIQKSLKEINEVRSTLDLRTFLGEELWLQLYPYIREGDYGNQNFSSQGLSAAALLHEAQILWKRANLEVEKASELQYSLSDNLNNLLNTEEFKVFKDKFEIGDFIMCMADEELYKLRLITVSYQYGSPSGLNVTFANVTKVTNYFSDVQNVLSQASSMSTSYQMVARQVDRNANTTDVVSDWKNSGLNSTLVNINNNNNEEVTMDNTGIVVKSFNDVTNRHEDQQLRLTHNILAFTRDNWKTAVLGLGMQDFRYFDDGKIRRNYSDDDEPILIPPTYQFVNDTDYGLNATFMEAGFVHGSQIVGGDIYSENYQLDLNHPNRKILAGSHIDMNYGTFEMAGGLLTATRTESNVYSVKVEGEIVANTGKIGGENGWVIKEGAIFSGLATFSGDGNGTYIGTDGIKNKNGTNIVSIKDGKITANDADISGKISASDGQIGGWTIGDGRIYGGDATTKVSVMQVPSSSNTWVFASGGSSHSDYNDCPFRVNKAGKLYATNAEITGGITAESLTFYDILRAKNTQTQNTFDFVVNTGITEEFYTQINSPDGYGAIKMYGASQSGNPWTNELLYTWNLGNNPYAYDIRLLGDDIDTYTSLRSVASTINAIGSIVDGANITTSIATNDPKSVVKVSLPAGVWVIDGTVIFKSNDTGRRLVWISPTADSDTGVDESRVNIGANPSGATALHTSTIRLVTVPSDQNQKTTDYYLTAYQASGGNLTVTPTMRAVRIK